MGVAIALMIMFVGSGSVLARNGGGFGGGNGGGHGGGMGGAVMVKLKPYYFRLFLPSRSLSFRRDHNEPQ